MEDRFWEKVDKRGPDDCWLWLGSTRAEGYGSFWTGVYRESGSPVIIGAHRWLYMHIHGPLAVGIEVCHSCDNPPCVNPAHLFTGTHTENIRDMIGKGRGADTRGERNGRAKLTAELVAVIRAESTGEHGEGMRLARRYGVTSATMSKVIRGDTWK